MRNVRLLICLAILLALGGAGLGATVLLELDFGLPEETLLFLGGILFGFGFCSFLFALWPIGGVSSLADRKHPAVDDVASGEQIQRLFLIGRLTAGIAHDFNNILTAMLGHVDSMLAQTSPAEPGFPELIQIKRSGLRAAHLVRQLLSFSRQQTVRPVILNLSEQVKENLDLMARLCGEKTHISTEIETNLWIFLDPGQLEQVLFNLVINARDSMPEGGQITVKGEHRVMVQPWTCRGVTMKSGSWGIVSIRDKGGGISNDIMPHIFDPYFTTKEVGKGTGLGLATVNGIIRQAGGAIDVQNHTDGGAEFVVALPLHSRPEKLKRDQSVDPTPRKSLSGLRENRDITLLVAEDDSTVRFVLVHALKRAGFRVLEADSGENALEIFEAQVQTPQMLISDIVMPGMDGPTLVDEVRKRAPDIKVVYVSGYAEADERRQVALDKNSAFLAKPFTADDLLKTIYSTLNEKK